MVSYGQTDATGDFAIETYAEGFNQPIAIAWAPDGRLFIAEREGTIRIVQDGVLLSEPFAQPEVYAEGEGGLLGLALSPDFESNGHVFAFATVSDKEQRILRWTDENNVGQSQTVIRGNLPTTGTVHNGGCIRFGSDGMLYFSVGDTGHPDNSQQIQSLSGKVCRITPDGDAPSDNPFMTPTGAARAIFASGFRNPFRFCFDATGRLFLMDVGSSGDNRREEINLVQSGKNYGWPEVEGFSDAAADNGFENPVLAYSEEGSSISGCVFYESDRYPAQYVGNLFHIDYVTQAIFRAVLSGDEIVTHEHFIDLENGPVDLALGIDGNLYYTELFSGRIMRVVSTLPDDRDTDDRDTADLDLTDTPDSSDEGNNSLPGLCGVGIVHSTITAMMMTAALVYRRRSRSVRR